MIFMLKRQVGIFSVPFEQVTMHQRSVGKRINFRYFMVCPPYGLSKDLQIPVKMQKQYMMHILIKIQSKNMDAWCY